MEPVSVHWTSPSGSVHLAGRLTTVGPLDLQRFTYDSTWLAGPGFPLGEGLPLESGPLLPPAGANEFGLFLDATPHVWGRRVLSRKLSPPPRSSSEFLVAAADLTRQGALRVSVDPHGPFLSDGGPEPVDQLSDLYTEVRDFQAGRETGRLHRLLYSGTSQGGFRPKAAVVDEHGTLWIAKFPSETDTYDVETCEAAALHIAGEAGLPVPRFRHLRVDADRAILLVERFDRTQAGRWGYQSMHTAARLGDDELADYRLMAATAGFHTGEQGVLTIVGLAALNIAVNNIDDHSRNLGFLQDGDGRWSPAPAFDIVPYPREGEGTPLRAGDRERSLEALLDIDWGVPARRIEQAVTRVASVAQQVFAVAVGQFGLDAEFAAIAESRRAEVGSLPTRLV